MASFLRKTAGCELKTLDDSHHPSKFGFGTLINKTLMYYTNKKIKRNASTRGKLKTLAPNSFKKEKKKSKLNPFYANIFRSI